MIALFSHRIRTSVSRPVRWGLLVPLAERAAGFAVDAVRSLDDALVPLDDDLDLRAEPAAATGVGVLNPV